VLSDHGLAVAIESLAARVEELAERPVDQRAIETLTERIERLTSSDRTGSSADTSDRITDAVRAEAELLTQRVAALAVGVEAARALLEQHVADTEHSVGRKATELTKRIASDFGIRTKNRAGASGGRKDPRELGPSS
jgi:prefoldin subunit 5